MPKHQNPINMKVTKIKTFPTADEAGDVHLIVKVETDEGIHGLGESGIRREGGTIMKAIEHLSEAVVGRSPMATEAIWQELFRGLFQPADRVYSCALSAIDMALWDIKGKALNQPVYALLGGPFRRKVTGYTRTCARRRSTGGRKRPGNWSISGGPTCVSAFSGSATRRSGTTGVRLLNHGSPPAPLASR